MSDWDTIYYTNRIKQSECQAKNTKAPIFTIMTSRQAIYPGCRARMGESTSSYDKTAACIGLYDFCKNVSNSRLKC